LKEILPKEKDISSLFVQFQALAVENGFFLSNIAVDEAPDQKEEAGKNIPQEVKKLNITLELIGDQRRGYTQLKEFIDSLERNLRLFNVNSNYKSTRTG